MEHFFTIIVIGKSVDDCQVALNSIKKLNYNKFNILISIGNNPSAQRNKASKMATGEYLLFLDNDSEVDSDLLERYMEVIENYMGPDIIGGPSIYHSSNSFLKNAVKVISSSAFGLAFSKARYTPIGEIRRSDEKELILCNLCIKKKFFLISHGFNTKLYPNEENEFLNRVKKIGIAYYHPLAIVRREAVGTLREYSFKFYKYGHGRAKHYSKYPSHFRFIYLLPSIFLAYILFIPFMFEWLRFYAVPLFLYLFLALATSSFNCDAKPKRSILLTTFLFFVGHLLYGAGYISYFFIEKHKESEETEVLITVNEIKL
jgi:glycosyltransferase involved in cell wall biosynthesis